MNLTDLFSHFTKTQILIFCLLLGVFLFIYTDPPYHFCNEEINSFWAKNTFFKKTKKTKSNFERSFSFCKSASSKGACERYFSYLFEIKQNLSFLSFECKKRLFSKNKIQKIFFKTLDFFIRTSWNAEDKEEIPRVAWFETRQFYLFCFYKNTLVEFSEKYTEKKLISSYYKEFSKLSPMSREDFTKTSLFSYSCL